MSEDLKEHIGEAMKAREELEETFKPWLAVNTEADVILEAKRIQEEDLRRGVRTKRKTLLNEWDADLAMAVENALSK